MPKVLIGAASDPGLCSWGSRLSSAESASAPSAKDPGRCTGALFEGSSCVPVAMDAGLALGLAAWLCGGCCVGNNRCDALLADAG